MIKGASWDDSLNKGYQKPFMPVGHLVCSGCIFKGHVMSQIKGYDMGWPVQGKNKKQIEEQMMLAWMGLGIWIAIEEFENKWLGFSIGYSITLGGGGF